jgi:hypothetical protein
MRTGISRSGLWMPFKPPVVNYPSAGPTSPLTSRRPLQLQFGFWSMWCSVVGLLLLWAAYETRRGRLLPKSSMDESLFGWATLLLAIAVVASLVGLKVDKRPSLSGWGCMTSLVLLAAWIVSFIAGIAGFGRYG